MTITTYTWIGASGADWSVAGDWSPAGGPPGIADFAIILSGGTVSVTQGESVDGLSVAAGGVLTLDGSVSHNSPVFHISSTLWDAGIVTLDQGTLVPNALTIAAGATLVGAGTVAGPVTNDGLLIAAPENTGVFHFPLTGDLVISGAVAGTGSIAISAAVPLYGTPFASTVELGGAASENVGFDDNYGVLIIDSPTEFTGTIDGFTGGDQAEFGHIYASDVVILPGISIGSITGKQYNGNADGGTLTLQQATGSIALRFTGNFTLADFIIVAGPQYSSLPPTGIEITAAPPCFSAGTRILTISGEVAVEELRIGDQVVTLCGSRLARIFWLGHRHVNCHGHPHPHDVWPIRIKAGAIADGVPHRDLWLSPEHAVLFRDEAAEVLVPIRHLVNGTTIVQVPCAYVTYWHVELASHDAIVAEGLPAETYLDTGNRADFANGGAAVTVHPRFADAVWRAKACAPQLRHGDALAALQYRLGIRAARCAGDLLECGGAGVAGGCGVGQHESG